MAKKSTWWRAVYIFVVHLAFVGHIIIQHSAHDLVLSRFCSLVSLFYHLFVTSFLSPSIPLPIEALTLSPCFSGILHGGSVSLDWQPPGHLVNLHAGATFNRVFPHLSPMLGMRTMSGPSWRASLLREGRHRLSRYRCASQRTTVPEIDSIVS